MASVEIFLIQPEANAVEWSADFRTPAYDNIFAAGKVEGRKTKEIDIQCFLLNAPVFYLLSAALFSWQNRRRFQ